MREQFTPGLEMSRRLAVAQGVAYLALATGVIFAGSAQHESTVEAQPKQEVTSTTDDAESKSDLVAFPDIEALNAARIVQAAAASRQHEREAKPDCWIPEKSKDGSGAVIGLNNTLNKNQENIVLACNIATKHNWGPDFETEWKCFVYAMDFESGFNDKIVNEIGAGGIPQAYPASKMGEGWYGDAAQQLEWVIHEYIPGRYNNSPCEARQHQIDYGSY